MSHISSRVIAAIGLTILATVASSVSAAPLANWEVDTVSSGPGGASVVYSNLSTASPVIGSGVLDSNNADSGIITSSFSTISLVDGQTVTLSGNMTILGAKPTGEDIGFRFGLLYEPGTETNPVDTNGWLGFMADNSNAGQASGRLWARNTAGGGLRDDDLDFPSAVRRREELQSILNPPPATVHSLMALIASASRPKEAAPT